jgi:hypothetical protein
MELFIPSLLALVLAAVVCFFILPKASPYILGSLAIAMFIVGAWQHYHMFPYEYSSSLFIDLLRDYSPFVMILAVILGGMIALMVAFGVSPPAIEDIIPVAVADILPANNTHVKANNGKANNSILDTFNMGKPANNASKPNDNSGILGVLNTKPANNINKALNNSRRNNLASPSFKTI